MGNYGLAGALKKPERDRFHESNYSRSHQQSFSQTFCRPPAFNPHFLFQEAMIRATKSLDISWGMNLASDWSSRITWSKHRALIGPIFHDLSVEASFGPQCEISAAAVCLQTNNSEPREGQWVIVETEENILGTRLWTDWEFLLVITKSVNVQCPELELGWVRPRAEAEAEGGIKYRTVQTWFGI